MKITTHRELDVFKLSFNAAMKIYHLSKGFPVEERYSLTDQIRRASRSVSANISEAFRAKKYEKSFVSKLVIAQCEAAETQTWLDFALECIYIENDEHKKLSQEYDHILAMIVNMITNADKWCF
jgi:four helix bundle protein